MKCPRCQQENPTQAKFCLECARPLALRCANCGTQVPTGAKFCFECATPVSASGSAPRSPDTYPPRHLAERIIHLKGGPSDVPATVQAILASRIDRLAPEDKELLQTASVIGKDVPFPLLVAIAELPDEDLRRGLGRLQAAEFLYETSLFPELECTFKHALTHEVAYGTLLHEHRRALHARIVEAVERLYRERLVEHTERLAHHAVRGEAWSKAVIYCRQQRYGQETDRPWASKVHTSSRLWVHSNICLQTPRCSSGWSTSG